MEWSPTHTTAVEVKLNPDSVNIYGAIELDEATLCFPFPLVSTSSCFPESAMAPSSSKFPEVPPSLPIPPPLPTPASLSVPSLLVPVRSPIHPSAPLCWMDAHASFQSRASVWQEDPLAPWQSSEPSNPPRPFSFSLAPCSLSSTKVHQSSDSTGLPCPSGPTLVRCRPYYTTVFHCSGCASSLHPSGSVGLLLPSSVVLVRAPSSYTPACHLHLDPASLYFRLGPPGL